VGAGLPGVAGLSSLLSILDYPAGNGRLRDYQEPIRYLDSSRSKTMLSEMATDIGLQNYKLA